MEDIFKKFMMFAISYTIIIIMVYILRHCALVDYNHIMTILLCMIWANQANQK